MQVSNDNLSQPIPTPFLAAFNLAKATGQKLEEVQQQLSDRAKLAARKIGARTFYLHGLQGKNPRYIILGCQGEKGEAQKNVARAINQFIKDNPGKRPDFIILNGDNDYEWGSDSPFAVGLQDFFYSIYNDPEFSELRNIPFFLTLGNHDAGRHSKIFEINTAYSKELELNQRAHTFLPNGVTHQTVDEIYALLTGGDSLEDDENNLNLEDVPVDLSRLASFNMFKDYYGLVAGDTHFICLDSNFLAEDFLDFHQKPNITNQITWLISEYQKAKQADRKIVITQHHPFKTCGKRILKPDTHHYLSETQQKELNRVLGSNTDSYNEFLRLIFERLEIKAELTQVAHDHMLSIYDDLLKNPSSKDSCVQLTVGGGGGTLQRQESYADHPHFKAILEDHGFFYVEDTGDGFEIEMKTLSNQTLKYKNHQFISESKSEQSETLRRITLALCDKYLTSLREAEISAAKYSWTGSVSRFFPTQITARIPKLSPARILSNALSYVDTTDTFSNYIPMVKSIRDQDYERVCIQNIIAYLNQPIVPQFGSILRYLNRLAKARPYPDSAFFKRLEKKILNEEVIASKFNDNLTQLLRTNSPKPF